MTANTPQYGWPYLTRADAPDGALLGANLALAVEATMRGIDLRLVTAEANILALQALLPLASAWSAYTPVWSSNGTPPNIGNGQLIGRNVQVGKTVIAYLKMVIGSTTTFGTGIYSWTLPTPARGTFLFSGSANVDDSGTGLFIGNTTPVLSAATVSCYQPLAPNGSYFDPTHPMTWAVNDFVSMSILYEAP